MIIKEYYEEEKNNGDESEKIIRGE